MGPHDIDPHNGPDVAPHPHMGLQTVTWLLAGEILHKDSLGTEQIIRPNELNLMTAGSGVSHSEENTGRYRGELHGMQLWVAQPEATRQGASAFEHHHDLPVTDFSGGRATVIVGQLMGAHSPARRDSDHMGAQLELRGAVTIALDLRYEHALIPLDEGLDINGQSVASGQWVYLAPGRDECQLASTATSRVLLIGGVPFGEEIVMWWNFVARDRAEIERAHHDWQSVSARFGVVNSSLPRTEVDAPAWVPR